MPAKSRTCRLCQIKTRPNVTGLCLRCYGTSRQAATPQAQVLVDRTRHVESSALAILKKKYTESLKTIEKQERELRLIAGLGNGPETYTIAPSQPSGKSEATAVLVASDWHLEENVGPEVGDLNTYSVSIATARAEKFFQKSLRLINLLAQDISIPTTVLALLGDFITGDIHGAENAEVNELQPIHAVVMAQNLLASGIEFLLDNSKMNFVIPCHSGNHARTTLKTRFASENGHSLEYLLYVHLAAYFRDNPRVTFVIPAGMHSYVQIYDQTVRFHHGHAVKYGGGVGGIYIPVQKAISQWNKGKHADLDVFGHFHQLRDGGNFLCNGSLIGYNAFALSIKSDYEDPKQLLFLMDKRRKRTCVWPILVK